MVYIEATEYDKINVDVEAQLLSNFEYPPLAMINTFWCAYLMSNLSFISVSKNENNKIF